jgi:hypothetical protein
VVYSGILPNVVTLLHSACRLIVLLSYHEDGAGIFLETFIYFQQTISGRSVAQAESRWIPTPAARVRVRAACEVCGGKSGTGAGFSPSTLVSPANHSTIFSTL